MSLQVECINLPLVLSDEVGMLLRLVTAHDGISVHQFISRAVVDRAEAIGIQDLADQSAIKRDGAAVARLAHNQEVDGSIPSPATNTNHSESRGGKASHREPSRCLGPP